VNFEDQLFQIEQEFWTGGKEEFLANLDERCLLAFPQAGQMHGVFSKGDIAETASTPGRWRDLKMSHRHVLRLNDNVALISYRADVLRADGQPYRALVSSTYIQRGGDWKLASHQHSPS
jgi:hypothetical protein